MTGERLMTVLETGQPSTKEEVNSKELLMTFSPDGRLSGSLGGFSEGMSDCEA